MEGMTQHCQWFPKGPVSLHRTSTAALGRQRGPSPLELEFSLGLSWASKRETETP